MKFSKTAKRIAMVGVIVGGNNVWASDKTTDLAKEASTFRTLQEMKPDDITQTKAALDGDATKKGQIQTIIDKYGKELKGFNEKGCKYVRAMHYLYAKMAKDMGLTLADDEQPTVTKALDKVTTAIAQLGFKLTDPAYKEELDRLKAQRAQAKVQQQQQIKPGPNPDPNTGIDEAKVTLFEKILKNITTTAEDDVMAAAGLKTQTSYIKDGLANKKYKILAEDEFTKQERQQMVVVIDSAGVKALSGVITGNLMIIDIEETKQKILG